MNFWLAWRAGRPVGRISAQIDRLAPEHQQGRPASAYAAFMLIETIRHNGARIGARTAELSWMLEDNKALEDILLAINSKPYKTYRIYGKPLS